MVLGGGTFGEGGWLGHEGRAIMSRISVLMKETQEGSLGPSARYNYDKKVAICEEVGPHQIPSLLVPQSWASQPPEM